MGAAAAATLAWPPPLVAQRQIVLNDASRLNPTPVARHWIATDGNETAFHVYYFPPSGQTRSV